MTGPHPAQSAVRGPQPAVLTAPGAILLVACYELGRQPLSLAWPAAYLERAGYAPAAVDAAVDELTDDALRRARLIAFATPMHTALRLAVRLMARARAVNPAAHRCAFGLYAGLNADYLLRAGLVDTVLSGEVEAALVELAGAIERGAGYPHPDPLPQRGRGNGAPSGEGVAAAPAPPPARPVLGSPAPLLPRSPAPILRRLDLPVPRRAGLPPLERYARLVWQGETRLAGAAESTRGCRHTCRHCPLTPIYRGRFFAVPVATVLADIRQQVAAGARHISFGDPDFLNGPTHALRVARALHAEFPAVTFDATIKIEHILKQRALFPELRALGCIFVVSAVESLSDEVLRRLDKGHTRADVMAALAVLDEAGIALRPSLLAFTPWTTLADYLALLDWVEAEGLAEHVDPVHFAIRLLIPPGSALLEQPETATWLGELDAANLTYTWRHPDPRMDELHAAVAALVEQAARQRWPATATLAAIRALAESLAGHRSRDRSGGVAVRRAPPPRLTETWFC
jgi:radical SAM superfamily enzyme YgiQ (UPF0313 family)